MKVFESLNDVEVKGPCAVAVGYFDGVHRAHRAVIEKAVEYKKTMGYEPLVFSFAMDENSPMKKKGALLLQSFSQKSEKIAALGSDYLVCPPFSSFMSLSPEEFARELLVEKFKAKAVICGYDYRFGKGAKGDAQRLKEILEPMGVEVKTVDAVMEKGEPLSSTRIRKLLEEGNVEEANLLLGYDFAIDYEVVHGRHLGSRLGFPTINQIFPQGKIVPKFGVYKTEVIMYGKKYMGITNVGIKPTVGETGFVSAETYIDNFSDDLYGERLEIYFKNFLRPEIKFESVEKLREAIANDLKHAKSL